MNSTSIQTNSSMLELTAASCVYLNELIDWSGQPEPSVTYKMPEGVDPQLSF